MNNNKKTKMKSEFIILWEPIIFSKLFVVTKYLSYFMILGQNKEISFEYIFFQKVWTQESKLIVGKFMNYLLFLLEFYY